MYYGAIRGFRKLATGCHPLFRGSHMSSHVLFLLNELTLNWQFIYDFRNMYSLL